MTPPYLKPTRGKKRKPPGRKKGHPGISRLRPEQIDHFKEHTLERCPECHNPVKDPIKGYPRYVEDIPCIEKPEVTKHTINGYWCSTCKKVVFPTFTDALPNAMIGLRLVVFTAWLHYPVGVRVNNIVKILSVVCRFKISAGGLTQAILMSLFRTADLQGQNPIEVVLCLAKSAIAGSAVKEESLKLAA